MTAVLVLVDDDDAIRYALGKKLSRVGFEIVAASDARSALALPEDTFMNAAAVITDVVMPGMDGRALGAALRGRFPRLPILYMSGFYDPARFARGGGLASMERFLEKPFTDQDLWRALDELGVRAA